MSKAKPKFELAEYRQFIRDAWSYVSIVAGRKLRAEDADRLSDEEIREIALLIDERAEELKKRDFFDPDFGR